jgi:CubicO group peptidase (beta-lactamase class C family)
MTDFAASIDQLAAETGFSGIVRVDRHGGTEFARAYGWADRAHGIANTLGTRFATASATKSLTALTVFALVEEGVLPLATTARSVLGTDLPQIDDEVTVEQLLAHRSGIGDYFDEEADLPITDYILPVPVHELAETEDYLRVLDGYPMRFAPGEQFMYCNSGYVVLALIAERTTGTPFRELVAQRVCGPAGMHATAFLRSDELPGDAAAGYLGDGLRTNVFHLPVRGSGDGGIYSTAADVHALWQAFFAGSMVSLDGVRAMVRPRSETPTEGRRYGLGFWLHASRDAVMLDGFDAGVSFRSLHDPAASLTYTVIANTHGGAWPVVRHLDAVVWD